MNNNGVVVMFMVLGTVLVVFARPFALLSLRPYFSKQQLAERDKPEHWRLRLFVTLTCAIEIVVGLFFVVAGVISLL
jgi:hypothetical protein